MKKLFVATITALLAISLTACGTSKVTEEKKAAEQAPKETTEVTEDEVIRLIDTQLSYEIEGELHEESAFLNHNEERTYSLYLFEEYTLVSEEPNKDIIVGTNENIFARIEIGGEIESLTETVKETATALDPETELNSSFEPTPFLEGAVWYTAVADEASVDYILVTSQKEPIFLTIHGPTEGEYLQTLLTMLETIELK